VIPQVSPVATVVVCEDDPATLELLSDHLEADRYRVLQAPCASDALRMCRYNQPDVLLLDMVLPDAPGIEVLRSVRGSDGSVEGCDPRLAIIILSGRGSYADRVRGLEDGADDYVVKPFDYREIEARISAVLRRRSERREGVRAIGDLQIDPTRRRVTIGDREVRLAAKEYSLLLTLAAEPHRVFTKKELLRDVWGFETTARTRTLDSHASRLRRKLDPDHQRYVFNIWGVGYRLLEA
jgi:DNA-binding response OmpR family regulator